MADHTTADDARRYRDPQELDVWKERDPLLRMRRFLEEQRLWSNGDQEQLELTLRERVDRSVTTLESVPPPEAEEMFRFTAVSLSSRQQEQLEECRHGRT